MSFIVAAAGTGGHIYPGLAVAEALVEHGVKRSDVLCVGGSRVESKIFPDAGFGFLELELRGLKRSLSASNVTLPSVVLRARKKVAAAISERGVKVVLGMGGYVTVPVAMAAQKTGTTLMVAEQNAGAGLANRIAARWSSRVFVSFPNTEGLPRGEWVGNPVRSHIARFDRDESRFEALAYYGLTPGAPVLGVFGGSLGAKAINDAVAFMTASWNDPALTVVHLVGGAHEDTYADSPPAGSVQWIRKGFEDRMDLFFAAVDLVVARAGGAVAEISATGTPSILVPGQFGSAGHQGANAAYLEREGAALILSETELSRLPDLVMELLLDAEKLSSMAENAKRISKPNAAKTVARAMIEAADEA